MIKRKNNCMSRLTASFLFPLTYVAAVIFTILVLFDGFDHMTVIDFLRFSWFFPYGLTVLLLGANSDTAASDALFGLAWAQYLIIVGFGIVSRSLLLYWVFVIILVLNIGGCYLGTQSTKQSFVDKAGEIVVHGDSTTGRNGAGMGAGMGSCLYYYTIDLTRDVGCS